MSDKEYPTNPLGLEDKCPRSDEKPCARRFSGDKGITWCFLHSGHSGPCTGMIFSAIPSNDFMPRKK